MEMKLKLFQYLKACDVYVIRFENEEGLKQVSFIILNKDKTKMKYISTGEIFSATPDEIVDYINLVDYLHLFYNEANENKEIKQAYDLITYLSLLEHVDLSEFRYISDRTLLRVLDCKCIEKNINKTYKKVAKNNAKKQKALKKNSDPLKF